MMHDSSKKIKSPRRALNIFAKATLTPLAASLLFPVAALQISAAQEMNPTASTQPRAQDNQITQQNGVYIYRVKVVQRDLDAVNYLHRSGSTTIGFEGTPLLPRGKGEAKVQSERGGITIDAKFEGLTPANGFGPEYLTYVLWAITPDGRPQNLGTSRQPSSLSV
jgi:hypothetical protein